MGEVVCPRCGAHVTEAQLHLAWTCQLCGYESQSGTVDGATTIGDARAALSRGEAGRAMQIVEAGLRKNPNDTDMVTLKSQIEAHLSALRISDSVSSESIAAVSEAENYALQATFILNEVQANITVYGSNSMFTGASPANVDLGLQYINRSLELFPDNPIYLNTKALLLSDGKGDKEGAKNLLQRAAELAPRDINIQNNLNAVKNGGCFIATAAFGTPFSEEMNILRSWRDKSLTNTRLGRLFIKIYYFSAPPIADAIRTQPRTRAAVRAFLRPLIAWLRSKSGSA